MTKLINTVKQVSSPDKSNQPSHVQTPLYLERLNIDKSIKQLEFDFLGELKNVCFESSILPSHKICTGCNIPNFNLGIICN